MNRRLKIHTNLFKWRKSSLIMRRRDYSGLPDPNLEMIREAVSLSAASSYLRVGNYTGYADGCLKRRKEIDLDKLSEPLRRPSLLRRLFNSLKL